MFILICCCGIILSLSYLSLLSSSSSLFRLPQLAPQFYKQSDPRFMNKRKRMERIEPLYDRFNPPESWRLSKRRG